MNKVIIGILSVLLIFLVACGPAATPAEPTEKAETPAEKTELEEVTIGLIAPLVGDASPYGVSSRTGVELALDEIDQPIKVIFENGGCNAKDATTAATKLINIDNVKVIIGTVCSSETLAIAPIAEENKVVVVSAASSSPDITTAGDYIFRTWPSDKLQGPTMANHMYAQGHRKVAVMHTNSDYNLGLANAFKEAFAEVGGEVIITETYDPEVRDFRTILTKVKAEDPDALYIVPYTEGGLLAKQTRELGLDQPIFAAETVGTQDFIDDAGEAAEGIIYATPAFDESSSTTADFMKKYDEKFEDDSPWPVISANSYDNFMLIAAAIAEKGNDADGIRDYLYNVKDYDGAAGMLTIDENGDALKSFKLMKIEGGEMVPLQ